MSLLRRQPKLATRRSAQLRHLPGERSERGQVLLLYQRLIKPQVREAAGCARRRGTLLQDVVVCSLVVTGQSILAAEAWQRAMGTEPTEPSRSSNSPTPAEAAAWMASCTSSDGPQPQPSGCSSSVISRAVQPPNTTVVRTTECAQQVADAPVKSMIVSVCFIIWASLTYASPFEFEYPAVASAAREGSLNHLRVGHSGVQNVRTWGVSAGQPGGQAAGQTGSQVAPGMGAGHRRSQSQS